jgi:hypothetical protein
MGCGSIAEAEYKQRSNRNKQFPLLLLCQYVECSAAKPKAKRQQISGFLVT